MEDSLTYTTLVAPLGIWLALFMGFVGNFSRACAAASVVAKLIIFGSILAGALATVSAGFLVMVQNLDRSTLSADWPSLFSTLTLALAPLFFLGSLISVGVLIFRRTE